MTYLEAVAILHDIELKYDVMSIKYKDVSLWNFLRLRLLDCISVRKEVRISASIVKIVLKSLFYGLPFQFCRKYDLWNFTAAERRKMVGNKQIHRISGALCEIPVKSLMIEKPSQVFGHYQKTEIEESNILSESCMLLMTQFFKRFSFVKSSDIKNHDIIDQILADYKLEFDYMNYVRILDAQRRTMNLVLAFSRRPKIIIFECPYDSMGYLWSFHEHNIKVVELQHGVLNPNHNAYNAKDYEPKLNPDAICVFGVEEYDFFTKKASKYAKDVYLTGLYMLEVADKFFKEDIFAEERKQYERIVVVSGQAGYEEQLAKYINKVAGIINKALFIYIPRHNDTVLNFEHDNIRLVTGVNIYQYLKWADIHITISSTTCLEAHYFHTPTIFYDYQKMASTYYSKILTAENAVVYLSSEVGFYEAYNHLLNGSFTFREIFTHNHKEKLYNIIYQYTK